MPKKPKTNLRWDNDSMVWRDADDNKVDHPRYANKPSSLDSKIFINAYMRYVADGKSLNDFMKVHGRFSSAQVQRAAKAMRKAYEDLTEKAGRKDSFKLLRAKKTPKTDGLGRDVANALVLTGMREEADIQIRQLFSDKN